MKRVETKHHNKLIHKVVSNLNGQRSMNNKEIHLVKYSVGEPTLESFEEVTQELGPINEGEIRIRNLYLSVDPYLREMMYGVDSFTAPYPLNEPFVSSGIGVVDQSKNNVFQPGDLVTGRLPWSEYFDSSGADAKGNELSRIQDDGMNPTAHLHVLGVTGLTAYFGMKKIGTPKRDETVVVSGAAGAVGSIAGQLAKLAGCRVVGIAGTDGKIEYLVNTYGFDAGINYKNTEDLSSDLKQLCPNGVDVYFDNVAGWISDAVMEHLNYKARVVIAGHISQYNLKQPELGPRVQPALANNSALMQGYIVHDYSDEFPDAIKELRRLYEHKNLISKEHVVKGLRNGPSALLGLFSGQNTGKLLIQL